MNAVPFTNSHLFKFTTFLVAASLVVAIFILGRPFLVPLAWSLLIALASVRTLDRIEYRLKAKRLTITVLFVVSVLILVILLFFFFYIEIRKIVSGMPELSERIGSLIHQLSDTIRRYGIAIPDHIDQNAIRQYISGHTGMITNILAEFGQGIGKMFLVSFYLFFLIYYRDNYLHYLEVREKTREKVRLARSRFNDVLDIINNFLYGLLIVTLIMAVMLYVIFLLIGLKFALFFAILVSLLTLIPYIGNPIGTAIVFGFGLITHEGVLVPALAVVGILVSNFLQESVFKPIIIGDRIKLNAFMIFISVIIGGLIWGIAGMILFMPLVGIAKLLLERNESTKPLAVLFTQLPSNIRHHFHQTVEKEIRKELEENQK